MTRSKASIEAQNRYDAKAYDRVLIRFPKGTKDRITATGETVNGIVKRLVLSWLDTQEGHHAPQEGSQPARDRPTE